MGINCMFFKAQYRFFLIVPLFLSLSLPVHAASVLDGFNPDADGIVYATALQADGKLLVGGAFTMIGGQAKNHIARLNTDGSVDTTFVDDADGDVFSIIVQSDGQILVGGAFTTIGGQTRNRIARLNDDGSAENSFDPDANNTVRAIALLLNGDIIIGGDFTTINSETRQYIARLYAGDGTLDPDYTPDANAPVLSLATQRNGKVIAGGSFTIIGGEARAYIARLNDINGSAETTEFDITANGAVRTIVIQTDNKILIGGDFTTLTDPNGSHLRNRVALLDADGDADFNFDPDANGSVRSIVLQSDGEILVAGDFTSIGGLSINRMARLDIEFGNVDLSFTPNVNGTVYSITVQAGGKILIGGGFTSLVEGMTHSRNYLARLFTNGSVEADFSLDSITNSNNYATISSLAVQSDGKILIAGSFSQIGGVDRNNVARFNADGSIDISFTAGTNGTVSSVVVQVDNKILVGGEFTIIGGQAIPYLARLNADGSVDTSFTPNPNSVVHAIAVQSDGKIIAGGQFLTIGGITSNNIARLYSSGTGDSSYLTTATNGPVYSLVVQSDGKLIVGGSFTKIGGQARKHIARLDADGKVDSTTLFKNSGADNTVRTLALQVDGKILVGGDFENIDLKPRNRIARLKADGDIDLTFDPDANGTVRSIAVQADTNILIGGDFTTLGGQPRSSIARLTRDGVAESEFIFNADNSVRTIVIQSDGNILAGGDFTTIIDSSGVSFSRKGIVQLAANLSVEDFSPDITGNAGATVFSIAVQTDDKILIGGAFTGINGENRSNLARLNSDGSVDTTFTADTNGIISSIMVQPDNKILVGGEFTIIGGQAIPYVARLNADGTVDTSFNPNPNNFVHAIAVQDDGQIIIGGQFTTIGIGIGAETRENIARLLSSGTVDTAYTTTTADGPVYSLVVQSDGKLVVGGAFSTIGGQTRSNIARLSTTGKVDSTTTFKNTGTNGTVRSLALQADGTILVGGEFTFIDGQTRNYIAQLLANGDIDLAFNPITDNFVQIITVQADGKILIGGDFSTVDGQPRNFLARISSNGVVEIGFIVNANATVRSIAVQSDGSILAGGDFATIDGQPRNYFARLKLTGKVEDPAIFPDVTTIPEVAISAIALQGDGKFLIGGLFSHINGIPSNHIARLHPNGSVDTSWNTSIDGEVTSIVILSNNKILICGNFTSITDRNAAYSRNYLARLNADGTVDQKFYPEFHGRVYAIVEEPSPTSQINGDILVVGEFTTLMIPTSTTGTTTNTFYQHPFIARLYNPDAPDSLTAPYPTLHTSFPAIANYPNGIIRTIALQDDGKILVGGDFTWIGVGVSPRRKIARITKTNGLSDSTFDPNANDIVRSIVVQPDGNILVGGDFTYIGNQTRNKIARLYSDSAKADEFSPNADATVRSITLQTDGKILAIGDFANIGGQPRDHIARLNPILGEADDFNLGIDPQATVSAIAVQKDGKIVIGGDFTTIDSQSRNRLARLSADSAALQALTLSTDGKTITWHRSQSSPVVHDVVFYESANNEVWLKMATAPTRIVDGWELTVPGTLFQRQNRYFSVSAKTSGGFYNGSTSAIQSVRQYFIDYYTLTITPKPTTGDVEANLGNIACGYWSSPDVCSEAYQANTALTLTATPVEYGYVAFDSKIDYIFTEWSGVVDEANCGTGTTNPLPVLMDANRTCTAYFAKTYTSLLDTDGNGSGTVDWEPENRIDGLAALGKVYEINKNAIVTAVADAGSVFTGWSGNCNGATSSFTLLMNRDKTCTATFEDARTLTITTSGTGTGTVGGAGDYALDSTASASAIAASDSEFTGWSGDCGSGTSSPVNVLMDSDKACNANFDIVWTTLTITTSGNGSGNVNGAGSYVKGTTVNVTAAADTNSIFTGWSGDCGSGTASPIDILMDADKTCNANFAPRYTLTISTIGDGSGTVAGAGTYDENETVQATATADAGSTFDGWGGDCGTGTTSPIDILMERNKYCTASFRLPALTVYLSGNGTGIVTSNDGFIDCPARNCSNEYVLTDPPVTLTATADDGFIFTGWEGNGINCPDTDPCTVTMDSYRDITATFESSFSWNLFLPAIIIPSQK